MLDSNQRKNCPHTECIASSEIGNSSELGYRYSQQVNLAYVTVLGEYHGTGLLMWLYFELCLFPILHSRTSWTHEETIRFSHVFRGYEKNLLGKNGLKYVCPSNSK